MDHKPATPKADTVHDPISILTEGAVAMHEMFTTWVSGGFTEDQALRLVAYTLAANNGGKSDG